MSRPADRLTDAVIALLIEDGFEGVSVRRVADRAGVSIGAVQHHFPTKAAMLAAAMERMSTEFSARLNAKVAVAGEDPVMILTILAEELLGIGQERRAASVIWLQRLARATVDSETAAEHAKDWAEVENLLTAVIAMCRPDRAAEWHRAQSGTLLALLDGLAAAILTEPERMPAQRARRLVDDHLTLVVGH